MSVLVPVQFKSHVPTESQLAVHAGFQARFQAWYEPDVPARCRRGYGNRRCGWCAGRPAPGGRESQRRGGLISEFWEPRWTFLWVEVSYFEGTTAAGRSLLSSAKEVRLAFVALGCPIENRAIDAGEVLPAHPQQRADRQELAVPTGYRVDLNWSKNTLGSASVRPNVCTSRSRGFVSSDCGCRSRARACGSRRQ